jgi:hypothetical protein
MTLQTTMAMDKDLSDEQIAQLLQEAEERLRNKPKNQEVKTSDIIALSNRYAPFVIPLQTFCTTVS